MSLTKKTTDRGNTRPAEHYYKWDADVERGYFYYYDRDLAIADGPKQGKKGANVVAEITEFFVLDKDVFCINGWNDTDRISIQSNEVRELDDMLIVKGYHHGGKEKKTSILLQGSYMDLKDQIKAAKGDLGKYTRCIYFVLPGTNKIQHMMLKGSAFSAWMDQIEKPDQEQQGGIVTGHWIKLTGTVQKQQGRTKYLEPIFAVGREVTDEELEILGPLDANVLQPYLTNYFATSPQERAQEDDAQSPTSTGFDATKWREIQTDAGRPLGELPIPTILDLKSKLERSNETDNDLYRATVAAEKEFRNHKSNWRRAKVGADKVLGDYDLEYITNWLKSLMEKDPMSKSRLLLEAAMVSLQQDAKVAEPNAFPEATYDGAEEEEEESPF